MNVNKPAMKMPELLVFVQWFAIGFIGAEISRSTYQLGHGFARDLYELSPWANAAAMVAVVVLLATYAISRGGLATLTRMVHSRRIDLLTALVVGAWSNELAAPLLCKFHEGLKSADPHWAPALAVLLFAVLGYPFFQRFGPIPKKAPQQIYLFTDDEIDKEDDDLLSIREQAESFAKTVLASCASPGLVFGVDAPWGVGKTSFINLAQRHWENKSDEVIVCRFEPLRYASEPDLADRLIRELTAKIQSKVFAPELRPAVSRYSRLIKGKVDVSFLGFKLSVEPPQENVDELLDAIDGVLRQIDRRIIIVIDDLDRLDVKAANNVLFATRRTYKLSQATYILCYDTEALVANNDEGYRAREFIEKFVTVKLSLFVDSSSIIDNFLRRDWERSQLGTVPSDRIVKLGVLLNELADILKDQQATEYLPLIGDLRKVKRFVNAMLLIEIEKLNLGSTDFDKRDLINLMLLHLNYPGLFRKIYAGETDGRTGIFAVNREFGKNEINNSAAFAKIVENSDISAVLLLKQLFDVETLELKEWAAIDQTVKRSRACFNFQGLRNLESYLKLIVRQEMPQPQQTFVFYKNAVMQAQNNASIESLLTSPQFNLRQGQGQEHVHAQFWELLVNQSRNFASNAVEDAIDTLIEYLPRYSSFDSDDRGLRQRSIYSLLRLLNLAGWRRTTEGRLPNTPDNVVEIALRIFGEDAYHEKGLLTRLASPERGVLGWNDLMMFRLLCSVDRGGQLYNLYTALIVNQDKTAQTTGDVRKMACLGMRKLSQEIFSLFKRTYIDTGKNFFVEADQEPVRRFLGIASENLEQEASPAREAEHDDTSIQRHIASARSGVKSFVIYQLSNSRAPEGSGVGCGYYDEAGIRDGGGIGKLMNRYVFDRCFNPDTNEDNLLLFLDHCLSSLSIDFFSDGDGKRYSATKAELPAGFDPKEMGRYWRKHSKLILERKLETSQRRVLTRNYTATYAHNLHQVFAVLDELATDVD